MSVCLVLIFYHIAKYKLDKYKNALYYKKLLMRVRNKRK